MRSKILESSISYFPVLGSNLWTTCQLISTLGNPHGNLFVSDRIRFYPESTRPEIHSVPTQELVRDLRIMTHRLAIKHSEEILEKHPKARLSALASYKKDQPTFPYWCFAKGYNESFDLRYRSYEIAENLSLANSLENWRNEIEML